jgi:chromosome segregation ATPase
LELSVTTKKQEVHILEKSTYDLSTDLALQQKHSKTELLELEQAVSNAKTELENIQTTRSSLENKIATLEDKAREDGNLAGAGETRVRKIEKTINSLEQKNTKLEKDLSEKTARAAELKSEILDAEKLRKDVPLLTRTREKEEHDLALAKSRHKDVQKTLADLEKRSAKLQNELAGLEQSRSESSMLGANITALRHDLTDLEARKNTIADAFDLHWGTVHAISRELIKRIDLLDDMIRRYSKTKSSGDVVAQLEVYKHSLEDILKLHNVKPYAFKEGTPLDLGKRRRVKIVEDVSGNRNSDAATATIVETIRPGYICPNGDDGDVILRKAEVITCDA